MCTRIYAMRGPSRKVGYLFLSNRYKFNRKQPCTAVDTNTARIQFNSDNSIKIKTKTDLCLTISFDLEQHNNIISITFFCGFLHLKVTQFRHLSTSNY